MTAYSNLNAALGVAQMEDLQRRLDAKRLPFDRYSNALAGIEEVELVAEPPVCRSNHWLISVRFTSTDPLKAERHRDELLKASCSWSVAKTRLEAVVSVAYVYFSAKRCFASG